MLRRERAIGGPAERTFESLIGLQLRPKRMREAAALWDNICATEGAQARDAKWSHPDLLPQLPNDDDGNASQSQNIGSTASTENATPADSNVTDTASQSLGDADGMTIDWDAELSKLLDEEEHKGGESDTNGDGSDDSAESGSNNETDAE